MTKLRTVGSLVCWTLHGTHRQHEVQAVAERCGIADVLQLPRILANNAYRRAVRTVSSQQMSRTGGAADDRSIIVKIVDDSQTQIVHQFLLGTVGNTGTSSITIKGAEFEHLCCCRFDKVAYEDAKPPETLINVEDVPDGLGREIGDALVSEYRRTAVDVHYTHGDIRTALVRALRALAGIQILEQGGLWFVPDEYDTQLKCLQGFVSMLVGNCRLVIMPQYDVAGVMDEINRRASEALDAQLADLISELETFASHATVKMSTLEARVESFDELRGRVEVYERILGNTRDEMKVKLNSAQDSLLLALANIKDIKEEGK